MKTPAPALKAPHPIDVEIGRRMREVRLRKGLSQSDLAQAIGVSFQQVQKYENGANRFSASRLAEAAAFLGVDPGELFRDVAEADVAAPRTRPMTRAAVRVAEIVSELSPAQQRMILSLAEELGGQPAP